MSARFFAAWAIAVTLAVVVPIAVPYVIWPPHEGVAGSLHGECGRRAEITAISAYHPVASLWPLSNEVRSCRQDDHGELYYAAEVTAHGPYGIPFAAAKVGRSDISWNVSSGGEVAGFIALLAGVAAVSMPFALIATRHAIVRRLALAA